LADPEDGGHVDDLPRKGISLARTLMVREVDHEKFAVASQLSGPPRHGPAESRTELLIDAHVNSQRYLYR
jgi:hypothetical protein